LQRLLRSGLPAYTEGGSTEFRDGATAGNARAGSSPAIGSFPQLPADAGKLLADRGLRIDDRHQPVTDMQPNWNAHFLFRLYWERPAEGGELNTLRALFLSKQRNAQT